MSLFFNACIIMRRIYNMKRPKNNKAMQLDTLQKKKGEAWFKQELEEGRRSVSYQHPTKGTLHLIAPFSKVEFVGTGYSVPGGGFNITIKVTATKMTNGSNGFEEGVVETLETFTGIPWEAVEA